MNWRTITTRVGTINRMKVAFLLLGAVILLFIFIPLFTMTVSSSPGELLATFRQGEVRGAILLSLYAALLILTCLLIFIVLRAVTHRWETR